MRRFDRVCITLLWIAIALLAALFWGIRTELREIRNSIPHVIDYTQDKEVGHGNDLDKSGPR